MENQWQKKESWIEAASLNLYNLSSLEFLKNPTINRLKVTCTSIYIQFFIFIYFYVFQTNFYGWILQKEQTPTPHWITIFFGPTPCPAVWKLCFQNISNPCLNTWPPDEEVGAAVEEGVVADPPRGVRGRPGVKTTHTTPMAKLVGITKQEATRIWCTK